MRLLSAGDDDEEVMIYTNRKADRSPQGPGGRAGSAAAGVPAAAGRGGDGGARQWAHSGRRGAGVEKLRGGRWRAGAAAALFAFQ